MNEYLIAFAMLTGTIEEPFISLASDFMARSSLPPQDFSIVFSELEGELLDTCSKGDLPRVSIDRKAWDTLSPTRRKILIYHELGHCLLNKHHTPTGIMRSPLLNDNELKNVQQHFEEFFKGEV